MSYKNPYDCKEYTLYGVDHTCLMSYYDAKKYCEKAGGELAPWEEHDSYRESSRGSLSG